MSKNYNDQSEVDTVRRKAEELLREKSEARMLELIKELAFQNEEKAKRAEELSVACENAMKLAHELEVHQIELETLNEELIQAKERADDAAKKYTELYDNAPIGYFILSKESNIIELNLIGAGMLGKERRWLKNSRFGFFVSNDTKPAFNLFLNKTFNSQTRETCDVTLFSGGKKPVHLHLIGIVNENREQCLLTIVDITGQKLAEEALKESEKNSELLQIIPTTGNIGLELMAGLFSFLLHVKGLADINRKSFYRTVHCLEKSSIPAMQLFMLFILNI